MRFITPNGIEVILKEWNGEFMKVATKLFQSKHPKIVQEIVTRFCVESIAGESDLERITSLTEIDIMAILIASRAYSFRFDPYVPIEKDWTGKDKKRFTHTHQIPLKYENLPIVYAQNVLANPDNRLFGKDKQAKYFDLECVKYETANGKKGEFVGAYEYLSCKEVEGENVIDFILFETDITNDEITLLNGIELSEFASDINDWELAKDSIQPIYESLDEYIEGLKYEVKLPAGERLKMTKPTLEFSNSYLKGKVSEGDFDTLILLRQPQSEGVVKFDIKNFSHAEKEYINKQIKTKEGSIDMKAKVSNPTNAIEVETVAYLMTLGFFSPSQA